MSEVDGLKELLKKAKTSSEIYHLWKESCTTLTDDKWVSEKDVVEFWPTKSVDRKQLEKLVSSMHSSSFSHDLEGRNMAEWAIKIWENMLRKLLGD